MNKVTMTVTVSIQQMKKMMVQMKKNRYWGE